MLAMPFAYRAIDAGLRALDLKTIVEARIHWAPAGLPRCWRVVLPNLTTAVLSAVVLTVALVLGEYTMASLALFQTFPVWIYVNSQNSGQISVAASLLVAVRDLAVPDAITVAGTRRSRRKGGGAVTLFTADAIKRPGGPDDHEHRQGRGGQRPAADGRRPRDERRAART